MIQGQYNEDFIMNINLNVECLVTRGKTYQLQITI